MLVLTRKMMESIIIGDNITVTIVDIGSGQVRVGIDAPREIRVFRKEVYDEIRAAAQESAQSVAASKQISGHVGDLGASKKTAGLAQGADLNEKLKKMMGQKSK